MKTTIRKIEQADIRAVATMHLASWLAAYDGIMPASGLAQLTVEEFESSWREELAHTERVNLLCETKRDVQGFVSFGPNQDRQTEGLRVGEIYSLYVHPIASGKGIGRRLCRTALDQLKSDGFEQVVLWVLQENTKARTFYEAAGFEAEPGATMIIHRFDTNLVHVRYRRQAD